MRTNPIKLLLAEENLAVEAISFQNDGFGEKLEQAIEDIRKSDIDKSFISTMLDSVKAKDFPSCVAFEELLFNRFGLKIDLKLSNQGPALYWANGLFNRNHIFLTDFQRELVGDDVNISLNIKNLIKLIKEDENNNRIDLVNAKVTGNFSKAPFTLYMPVKFFKSKQFTTKELAAVILHEIGHGFTFMEFTNKVSSMNEMLSIITNDAFNHISKEDRQYVIRTITKSVIVDKEFEDALSSDNTEIRSIVVLKEYFSPNRSALNSMHYDATICESLADNFSARFGYSVDLITCLDKITTWYPENSILSRSYLLMTEIVMYLSIPNKIMSGPVNALIVILSLIRTFSSSGEINSDFTYDKLHIRYLRIREQVISFIKDKSLPKEIVDKALFDIEEIDKILKRVKDYDSLTTKFFNHFFVKHKNAKNVRELQRLLEELGNNDLFIQAAKLKNL